MTRQTLYDLVVEASKKHSDTHYKFNTQYPTDRFIVTVVHVGGMSGGSCYDNSEPTYQTVYDVDLSFKALDEICLECFPAVPFLVYNKLVREAETVEATEYEYYGNTSDYKGRALSIDKFVDIMLQYKVPYHVD